MILWKFKLKSLKPVAKVAFAGRTVDQVYADLSVARARRRRSMEAPPPGAGLEAVSAAKLRRSSATEPPDALTDLQRWGQIIQQVRALLMAKDLCLLLVLVDSRIRYDSHIIYNPPYKCNPTNRSQEAELSKWFQRSSRQRGRALKQTIAIVPLASLSLLTRRGGRRQQRSVSHCGRAWRRPRAPPSSATSRAHRP